MTRAEGVEDAWNKGVWTMNSPNRQSTGQKLQNNILSPAGDTKCSSS